MSARGLTIAAVAASAVIVSGANGTEACTGDLYLNDPIFDDIQPYSVIADKMEAWAGSPAWHPDLQVTVTDYGTSSDGQQIKVMTITGLPTGEPKPDILYTGAQHGNEWVGPMQVMSFAAKLLNCYGKDDDITAFLDKSEIHLVPVVNPDGLDWSLVEQVDWHKNRQPNDGSCVGTDLNRNWDFQWDANPQQPCQTTYPGPSAFSAPETGGLAQFVMNLDDLRGSFDFHNEAIGGQPEDNESDGAIAWPWSYTTSVPAWDAELATIANRIAAAIPGYPAGSVGQYPNVFGLNASGTMIDWLYGNYESLSYHVSLYLVNHPNLLPLRPTLLANLPFLTVGVPQLLGQDDDDFFQDWQDCEAIDAKINEWEAVYGGTILSVQTAGSSYEFRPINAMVISNGATADTPTFIYVGGMAARAWIGPMAVMCLADHLLQNYGLDPLVTQIVDNYRIVLVPCANPDGIQYTWTDDRLWRKTRNDNPGSICVGTDLNRNFDCNWAFCGAGLNPCSDTFPGQSPFSTPEAQTLRDLVLSYDCVMGVFNLSGRSWPGQPVGGGGSIVFPWFSSSELPRDYKEYIRVMDAVTDRMESVNGNQYIFGTGFNTFYCVGGSFIDWAYDATGALSFQVSFALGGASPAIIRPTCAESLNLVTQAPFLIFDQFNGACPPPNTCPSPLPLAGAATASRPGDSITDGQAWDLNGDGMIDSEDFSALFSSWGASPGEPRRGDLDQNGFVDMADLMALLQAQGMEVQPLVD